MNVTQLKSRQHQPIYNDTVIGELVEFNSAGCAVVDFVGNLRGPMPAQSIVAVPANTPKGSKLLLCFVGGEVLQPIILGVIRAESYVVEAEIDAGARSGQSVRIDGQRMLFDAKEEIVLRCGAGSITLKANGKIVIKGNELTTRAMGSHKIRGGTVDIN